LAERGEKGTTPVKNSDFNDLTARKFERWASRAARRFALGFVVDVWGIGGV
jgi:hypothetical protein